MLRYPRWLFWAAVATSLHGAEQAWFMRAWSTDEGLPNNHVTAVAQTSAGDLYVDTRAGAAKFDGVRFTPVERITENPDASTSLRAVTTAGEVWQVRGNAVGMMRGDRFSPFFMRMNPHIAASRDGRLWVAFGGTLGKVTADNKLEERGQFEPTGPRPHVMALLEDHTGAVWIGTATNGLYRYDGERFEKVETSYSYVLCLAEDSEGNLWVGTDGGGLDRITTRFVSLETFSGDRSTVGIQSICEDTAGKLWGVTQNRWLVTRENGVWRRCSEDALRSVDAPLCVDADRSGGIWIGTARKMFFRWRDGELKRWNTADGLTGISVHAFLAASDGDVWLGEYNRNAVHRLREGKLEAVTVRAPLSTIRSMCEDTAGNIWVGTDGGLLVARKGSDALEPVPVPDDGGASKAIMCLLATDDGVVWAGCAGGGLLRASGGQVVRFGTDRGLPDPYISQMVADNLGWLWIGSADHGIYKVRFDQLDAALHDPGFRLHAIMYGHNEGLSHLEAFGAHSPDAIGPSAIRTRDGRIWIPMRTALAVVEPKLLKEDTRPPPVHLTRIVVDGEPLNHPLRVNPDHRRIDFEFSVLNLSSPENAHARYRLDGIDAQWVDPGMQRVASYTRLAPGRYTFRLESANGDGPWSGVHDPVTIVVLPYYWQTWWFRLAALAVFTAATAAVAHGISTRRLRARQRKLEQQSALDRERARIARDLHDDLGGSLTQVGVMLDLAHKDAPGEWQPKLGHCVSLVRGAAQSVDEIIWAINPRNDTLPHLIDYLSQFVVEFLHAAGIECTIELPETLPDRLITPETRHHLFLVVKECVANVSRHAHATEVRFAVEADATKITIVIEDNGTGFTTAPDNATADGLRNIRHRMTEIGGTFAIESRSGGGTRASLIYPWLTQ